MASPEVIPHLIPKQLLLLNLQFLKSADSLNNAIAETETAVAQETESNIPTEYKSALKKAESYSNMMHMSKQGIYDQLTSEYGEKFSPEAAQYAIDNMQADWNANALEKG